MKQLNFTITLMAVIFTLGISLGTFGQKTFEGSIIYEIEYLELSPEVEEYKNSMPQKMKIMFKGDKFRLEQSTAFGNQVIITDQENKETVMLMDLMGQKIALKVPAEDYQMRLENLKDQRIEYVPGTKTIAGFECEKAIVTNPENGEKLTVYFTTAFENPGNRFMTLKGFPLLYEDDSQTGMQLELEAAEVKEENISDEYFKIPEQYKVMTQEEMQEMFNGFEQ